VYIFNYNQIKKNSTPYVIAEIGVNHECSMQNAKKLILSAKRGGAHAAKFQTYKAHKITSKSSKYYWDLKKESTRSQFELFSKYDKFNEENYVELAQFCKKNEIDFLSTPFDLESVDFLCNLMPAYKVSSSDITNFPLLEKISQKKKPVLLSTGASSIKEIRDAVKIFKKKTNKLVIMHCILNYPTKNHDANLRMIESLKKEFPEFLIGYSDHTLPDSNMQNLCSAYTLGANVIEKHYTLNKRLKGNDHYHSMDEKDLKNLTLKLKKIKISLGVHKNKKMIKTEKISKKNARRSIVLKKNVTKGQILKKDDLICKRPATGISPIKFKKVIGKKVKHNLEEDYILKEKDLF